MPDRNAHAFGAALHQPTRQRPRVRLAILELLIVIVVGGILTAALMPGWTASTEDARQSVLEFNLRTIRSQIDLYSVHHAGRMPTAADFVRQMTEKTNAAGGFSGDRRYGPYLRGAFPGNPFNGSNAVAAVALPGRIPEGPVPGGAGWQYDETTGGFYPNHPEWYGPDSP